MQRAGGIAVGLERLGLRRGAVPVSERALGARVGAWLWAGGAALILVSSFLPGSDGHLPLVPLTAAALALAAVNLVVYEQRADWILHALLAAGTVVVSALVHWGGDDAQLYALLYLWVGLYAAYFLDLRPALLHLAGLSAAYGVVVLGDPDWPSLQAWLLRTGTLVGAVLLVLLLKGRVARGAAELARRARQQEALAALGRRALVAPDLESVAEEAAALLRDTLGLDHAAVLELRDGELRTLAGERIASRGCVSDLALAGGGVTVVDAGLERFPGSSFLHERGAAVGLAVAIGEPAAPWGVLGAASLAPRSFSAAELDVVQGVANVLGAVVERRRADAELQRSLSLLQATLESTGDGILVVDADGRVAGVNRTFCELWGIEEAGDREALLARAAAQVVDPEAFLARAHALFADREASAEDVLELADGRVLERYTQPQRLGAETVGRVWSFRDVTARRVAEQELERSRQALLQAQKMEAVGRLAGGIAHDFNNLLTAIGGYAELLQAGLPEGDPLRRDVGEIRRASDRAAALTRQLLAFSRRQVLRPAPLRLDDVVAGVETMLRRLIGEDVELAASAEPGLWTVSADPGQLEQVLVNLAVNARDAMPAGGRLTLETANATLSPEEVRGTALAPGDHVRLRVTDTGVGMEPEVLARVFEPFFTTKEQGKGTGLGLATVHGIVRQSGGDVLVRSAPGAGTVVEVHLPRAAPAAAVEAAPPHPAPHAPGGSETVLLVEDEESVRALAARVLELAGYRVLVAGDGEDALAVSAAHEGGIDLVVTDVVMPRLGGRQLAGRLAATRPEARVLFMSGYAGEAVDRHGALEPGAHFLGKPFAPDALARKVREVLDA